MPVAKLAAPAIYALIICAHSHTPCEAQKAAVESISKDECVERLQLFRWTHPEQRVLCASNVADDMIDTDELDKPDNDDDFEFLPLGF